MLRKTIKTKILAILPLLAVILAWAFTVTASVIAYADSLSLSSTSFNVTQGTNVWTCYPITNRGYESAIAVAWGKSPSEGTGSVEVPSTITYNGGSYTVKAVAKSGFRFTKFTSITLPSTVEEIQTEAFYCCLNLTSFTLPGSLYDGIGPSAFMDCRSLESIDITGLSASISGKSNEWLDEHGFEIGSHAFTNCVSLKEFDFPANLTLIGHSAFERCSTLYWLFLPADNGVNTITIEKYAFADCSNFTLMHFETNVTYVDEYAFAKCEKLKLFYTGTITDNNPVESTYSSTWRKKHVATDSTDEEKDYVPIEGNIGSIEKSKEYPGIIYTKQNANSSPIYIDCNGQNNISLFKKNEMYVTIFRFFTPTTEKEGYYDLENDYLTIPETIDGARVRKIAKKAFTNEDGLNKPLKKVVFPKYLLQICEQAFYKNNEIEVLDFSGCTELSEVSNNAFQTCTGIDNYETNTKLTSLTLPKSLAFIGQGAFSGFTKVQSFSLYAGDGEQLKFIGKWAFLRLGYDADSDYYGKVDLVLPETLRDKEVDNKKPIGYDSINAPYPAVGTEAFAYCPILRSVTMRETSYTSAQTLGTLGGNGYSFGEKAFLACSHLLRVKTSYRIRALGKGCFERCTNLKEFLLCAPQNDSTTGLFMWGYGENRSIFLSGNDKFENQVAEAAFQDLVIYVTSDRIRKNHEQKGIVWNTDTTTYPNEYASLNHDGRIEIKNGHQNEINYGRPLVPTYYNVDFLNGELKYIDITNAESPVLKDEPVNGDGDIDYTNLIAYSYDCHYDGSRETDTIAAVKDSNYTITKCYASGKEYINLDACNSAVFAGSNSTKSIVKIGSSAMSTLNAGYPASKVILPSTVTEVHDYAFYSTGDNGLQTLTYKSEGVEKGRANECTFPANLTKISRFSFYNNRFTSVVLPSTLTFLGNTAFACSASRSTTIISLTGNFANDTSPFSLADGRIIDKNTMTLLYQISGTGPLDLSGVTGLKAIGPRALVKSGYSSVTFPTSLTTIYGGAFASSSIQSVTGTGGLAYIAAAPRYVSDSDKDTDVWNFDENFDLYDFEVDWIPYSNIDTEYDKNKKSTGNKDTHKGAAMLTPFHEWAMRWGAFADCASLTDFDFASASGSLRKIGPGTFNNCTNLCSAKNEGMANYVYYDYDGNYTNGQTPTANTSVTQPKGQNVLDLSVCTGVESIGRDAFNNCTNIHYAHLPFVKGDDTNANNQSRFCMSLDMEDPGSWADRTRDTTETVGFKTCGSDGKGAVVLVGESAQFAKSGGQYFNTTKKNIRYGGFENFYNDPFYHRIDVWNDYQYIIPRYCESEFDKEKTYYYVSKESDICKTDDGKIKYWTYYGEQSPSNHNYILFDSKTEVQQYY